MIQARGLVQTFHTGWAKSAKEVRAVDGVDLDVHEGEVVGFLGPNGAGKTTTLRIDLGRIVASDTADNLKAQVAGDLVDLEMADADQVAVAATRLEALVHGAGGIGIEGRHVRARVQRSGRVVPALLRDLDSAGVTLDSIEVFRPTLDDVFLSLTGRSLRDADAAAPNETPTQPEEVLA